jgi:hypothetical protein
LQVTQFLEPALDPREAQRILDDCAARPALRAGKRLGIPREIRWQGDCFLDGGADESAPRSMV